MDGQSTILSVEEQIKDLVQTNPPKRGFGFPTRRFKDVEPHHIPQPEVQVQPAVPERPLPEAVSSFLDAYKKVQEDAAKECIATAEWLEAEAADLRNRAAVLNHQSTQIPQDFAHSVRFEDEAHRRVKFLASIKR